MNKFRIDDTFFGDGTYQQDGEDLASIDRAVQWFLSFFTPDDWKSRRISAAERIYQTALRNISESDRGRLFLESDTFAWYLFLAESFVYHPWNYDPVFGARVVPVFQSIGRNLPLISAMPGVEGKVRQLVSSERRQPNGGLFELLVAAAYARSGADVAFRPEEKGIARTYDLDVNLDGRTWAVECKRMEQGEYSERERQQIRKLWSPIAASLAQSNLSVLCKIRFNVPIEQVTYDSMAEKVCAWNRNGRHRLEWDESDSSGSMEILDLSPLRKVLRDFRLLNGSPRLVELLTGSYTRHAPYVQTLRVKIDENPRYIVDCDLAILLCWESASAKAIDNKARDVFRKVVEANEQLPTDRPGLIHVGFEAVEGDSIEIMRHQKIIDAIGRFDPNGKSVEYVYSHYFVPESPPDIQWAFDETTQWCPVRPSGPPPLAANSLVLPSTTAKRLGPHWIR